MEHRLSCKNYFGKNKEHKRKKYLKYLESEHWQELRREKLKQVGYKCQDCGSSEELQVHHKRYDNLASENLWDLQVLCDDCHTRTHDYDWVSASQRSIEKYCAKQEFESRLSIKDFSVFIIFPILFILFIYLLITHKWVEMIALFILSRFLWEIFKH